MLDFWEMLGLELTVVLATVAMAFFVYFFIKFLKTRSRSQEILPFLGLILLFLSFGFAFFLVSWYDFFWWENGLAFFGLFKIYSFLLTCAVTAFMFIFEYILRKTKYIFTIYLLIGTLLLLLIPTTTDEANFLTTIIAGPFFILIPIIWYLIFIKPTSGYLKRRMLFTLVGILLLIVCLVFRRFGADAIQLFSIATVVGLVGGIFVAYGFAAFSTFTDIVWKDKLRELFIISPKGICLYAFSFDQKTELAESDLIAGGFSGIQMLLSELVKTDQPMQLIEYQDVKILVEHHQDIVFILLMKEESRVIEDKLKLFAKEFYDLFKEVLRQWEGELGIFIPARTLIQRIFELEVLDK